MSEATAPKASLKEHNIKLSTVVFIMYCLVAGGAFGIEEMVSASGPGLTLLMLAVLPFIWAAPQALVSAELGTAMPVAGGFYKWVQRGLGEFWAFQAGWCRTVSSYLDNTIYVVLAVSYLGMLLPLTEVEAYVCKATIIVFFTYINLCGIKEVGKLSTFFSLSVMIAFAFIALVGFINWNQNPITPFIHPDKSLFGSIGASLAIGMWCYSGYTSMSTLSGEIKDKTLIPKGLLIIVPLSALSYILPTLAGLASIGSWDKWSSSEGGVSYATVGAQAGDVFYPIFLCVAILASLSIFNAYIISISRCFFSMAEDNLSPKSLVKLSKKNRIPYVGVLSLGVFCLFACTFDFTILVTISVMLLMADYVLVWIAGFKLRQNEPNMPRPFKIPVGTKGFALIIAPGITIAIVSLLLNGTDYFLGGMFGLISAPVMYFIFKRLYGGLAVNDPVKYPLNPKTKLAFGDLYRIAAFFGAFAVLGFIGCFFFPWYEGAEASAYYADTYGYENTFAFLLSGIKWTSLGFALTAIILTIIAYRVEPRGSKIFVSDSQDHGGGTSPSAAAIEPITTFESSAT